MVSIPTKSELENIWNSPYYGGSTLKTLNKKLKSLKKFQISVDARKVTIEKKAIIKYTIYAANYQAAETEAMNKSKVEYPDANQFRFTRLSS